jgi:hypothetical protein
MTFTAPPLRTASGVIVPTHGDQESGRGALVASAALTTAAIVALAVLSWWYPMIAFLAAGAGAGYSLSGSV